MHGHPRAVAAEMLAAFADSVHGRVTTKVPEGGHLYLVGNMDSATITVTSSPNGKVNVEHEFPGQQKPISRLALMPDVARQVVLGIVNYGGEI